MKRNLTNELEKEICRLQQEESEIKKILEEELTDEEICNIILSDSNINKNGIILSEDELINCYSSVNTHIDEIKHIYREEYYNDMLDSFGSLEWLNDSKYDYYNISGVIVG